MVSIRRKLGAFVAAAAIASVMMLGPASIDAKGQAASKNETGTVGGFCAQLESNINYLRSLPSNLAVALALKSYEATFATFCE